MNTSQAQAQAQTIWDLDEKNNTTAKEYCKKFINSTNETKYKVGDKILFYTGYNDDILASATIKGIDKNDIYVYSDCYWFPIQDDSRRKIQLINH